MSHPPGRNPYAAGRCLRDSDGAVRPETEVCANSVSRVLQNARNGKGEQWVNSFEDLENPFFLRSLKIQQSCSC